MTTRSPVVEDGIIAGSYYPKHQSKNFIARTLMNGFYETLKGMVANCSPKSIHEFGCGEGFISALLGEEGYNISASDFSPEILKEAKLLAESKGLNIEFNKKSLYDKNDVRISADMVICCEVLEHLEDPESALKNLSECADAQFFLFSVPREPIWRIMNMCRFKYLGQLGNTPGHLQNWSSSEFKQLIERHFNVVAFQQPLPWTFILCKKKSSQ